MRLLNENEFKYTSFCSFSSENFISATSQQFSVSSENFRAVFSRVLRFVDEMKKHSTDVKPLLKNATKFGQPLDRRYGVRVKKKVKKNFRGLLEMQCEKLEKFYRVKKIGV